MNELTDRQDSQKNALRITFENKKHPIVYSLIYDEIDLKKKLYGKKTWLRGFGRRIAV